MEEDNNFFNQRQRMNFFNLQQQVLCHETESHYPYPSLSNTLVEASTTTTNLQRSHLYVQNNPSTTILDKFMNETASFHSFGTNSIPKDGAENALSSHILPFMNSTTVEPVSNMRHGSVLGSFKRNHNCKPGTHKKVRSSAETAGHIEAERKRRQKMTQNFIALSAIIPGLKKTDKSYILQEAINYVNQLQERVRELETENEKINAHSVMLNKKLIIRLPMNEDSTTTSETNFVGNTNRFFLEALPEVTTRVSEKNVLIAIHCEKQNVVVHKILNLLANLHLSITSSSVLQFGASTLIITIIAQMDEEYSMAIDDLVKTLRKELLKSHDVQQ
ncbi:Myc-type, basic helix-loop-helix [Sesbania bispinosa]|nr:Myc-type, basic helix-loop-helix [Sesbania bispinosa]